MKNQSEIIVEIDEQGTPKVEVMGYVGKGCEALTEGIERALGAVAKQDKKLEYFRQEVKNVVSNRR